MALFGPGVAGAAWLCAGDSGSPMLGPAPASFEYTELRSLLRFSS